MCVLVAEILMLVGGLYALIAGKVRLTRNMYLEGPRARVAGLFLVAPLPLAFVAGLLIAMLISMGALPASAESVAGIVELLLVVGGLAGAVVFALATKPKEEPSFKEELQSEDIEELLPELEEESTAHERVEEGRVPVVDLEASQEEASVPPDLEVSLPSLDWKFWLDFVGAGLLGGLTVGALGGFAAGTALYTVQGGLVAGALGGAVGGLVGGLVQWLALRRYTAKAGIWVIVCCLVGVVTWAMATGWAEASGDTWDVIAQVGTWVIAGILAGAVGGAVSGFVQARLLRQRISRVANRWVLVNTVGWAAGGAVFLPAYWGWGIGLIGGGNPGAAAGEAIRSNDAICMPVCLTLFAVVPIWAVIQAIRRR